MKKALILFLLVSSVLPGKDYKMDRFFPQLPQPWYGFSFFGGLGTSPQGKIYAAGWNGITVFDGAGQVMAHFPSPVNPQLAPLGLAANTQGEIYGSTHLKYLGEHVFKLDPQGNLIWDIQEFGGGDSFNQPNDVALGSAGNVYVADGGNCRVVMLSSSGQFIQELGGHRCPGPFGTGDGILAGPAGLDVDNQGKVYVADTGNNRIVVFDHSGSTLIFGSQGSGPGQFQSPMDVAVDGMGNIYVADGANNRIQKFTNGGQFISTWGTAGHGQGQFDHAPFRLAYSNNKIFANDTDRIQIFDLNGIYQTAWTSGGTDPGYFWNPNRVAVDDPGNIYVADTDNNRIQKFDKRGKYLSSFGSYGTGNGQFNLPRGVNVDDEGSVYVADTGNNRMQKFDKNFQWVGTVTGKPGQDYTSNPIDVVTDRNGNIYVLTFEGGLWKYDKNLSFVTILPARPTTSYFPSGVDMDNSFFYYVAGWPNLVFKYDKDGNIVDHFGGDGTTPGKFTNLQDIAVDNTGKIFVSDKNRIQVFDSNFNYLTEFGNTGGDFDRLMGFKSIAVANNGDVIVGDSVENRVCIFTPVPGKAGTIPGAAKIQGAFGKTWRTDLILFNPTPQSMPLSLDFISATGEIFSQIIDLPSLASQTFNDIVGSLFGLDQAFGYLQLTIPDQFPPMASARTYVQEPMGTYGQGIPQSLWGDTFGEPDTARFNGLAQSGTFHTNLGTINLRAAPLELALLLRDPGGGELESRIVSLAPLQIIQDNFILLPYGEMEGAWAEVRSLTEDSRWTAYASVVDDRTGDPVFFSPQRRDILIPQEWSYMLPAAASTPGGYGTQWRTALQLTNASECPMQVTLKFYEHDQAEPTPLVQTVSLDAGTGRSFENVLTDLFGMDATFGYILIQSDADPFLASSRTFTEATGGTYGQGVPIPRLSDLPDGKAAYLIGLEESDAFRSNVGFLNPSDQAQTLTIEAIQGGTRVAANTLDLPPYGYTQINSLLSAWGISPPATDVTLKITPAVSGPFFAYLSKVDNATGDPVFQACSSQ